MHGKNGKRKVKSKKRMVRRNLEIPFIASRFSEFSRSSSLAGTTALSLPAWNLPCVTSLSLSTNQRPACERLTNQKLSL